MVTFDGVLAGDPALQVRQVAVGRVDLLAGEDVGGLDAVADGVDVRVRGLHVLVHDDAARLPDLQPGVPREPGVGRDADRDHGELAFELGPVGELDADEPAVLAEELGDAVVENDVGALAPNVKFDELGELPVEEGEDLRQELDDRDLDPREAQRLAGLDADQTAADDDGLLRRPLVADLPQEVGILHRLERGDALEVNARERRELGRRAGRQNELVVRQVLRGPVLRSFTVTVLLTRSIAVTSVSVRATIAFAFM